MNLISFLLRLRRLRAFCAVASSLRSIPALAIAGIARDGPFGASRGMKAAIGKIIGEVGVRTRATLGEPAWVDTHDLGHLISCEEVLVEGVYDLSRVSFEPDVVFDCGAHIGLFTLIAGLRFRQAQLLAYEPNKKNFHMATRQVARFRGRVQVIEAAVATWDGVAGWVLGESNTGRLSDSLGADGGKVRTIDLAGALRSYRNLRMVMKMDIEGEERSVLPHVIRELPVKCALFFETHTGEGAWIEIRGLLEQHGFHVARTRHRGEFSDGFAERG
jgi:FkbM family methyltransferase